ncbi:MAG: hypothetical protein K6U04_11505 [Armatimonadetes bacterium]|nr:hypothetical protein [Armatimonadota bacterium]
MKIPIEEVQIGDRINGKVVVDMLPRLHANYIRITLEGGDYVDGYMGRDKVEVDRSSAA